MKYLCGFKCFLNEAIIDWESQNIKDFYEETLNNIIANPRRNISFEDLVKIGESHEVEIVHYTQFYNDLPDDTYRKGAPPSFAPYFALVNEKNRKIRVVLNDSTQFINGMVLDEIYHMMKHENVHLGQLAHSAPRKLGGMNVKDQGEYFSDKDELMAFSQSVSDKIMDRAPKDMATAIKYLKDVGLWNSIKGTVKDPKLINRYKKYIYLYLEAEFKKRAELTKKKKKMPKKKTKLKSDAKLQTIL